MKAKLLKSFLLSALAVLCFGPRRPSAQTATQAAAQSPPQQSTAAETWERYTYEDEEFSVELPGMPFVAETMRRVGPIESEPVRTFGLYSGGVIYMVTSYDHPREAESLDYFAGYYWNDPNLKAVGNIKLGGFEGREYESSRGYTLRARVFRAKRHAYRVRAMSYGDEDPRVARFLDSFALGGKTAGRRIREPSQPAEPPPAAPPVGIYKPSEVTRKAIIVFKPEPGYTDSARRNNTSGIVRLRAVLASDGKLKNISVVKDLPDGLTTKAVNAARHILFFPAFKDGSVVSQYVTLEYNFNIY